jgi:3-oxoacyl-[acyl-carrier protein] reductase
LARELGPEGITVNAICPGVIDTLLYHEEEVTLWMKLYDLARDEALRVLEEEPALARLGSPEEVANLVVFLASDQASYITGQAINVCGGLSFH